MNPLVSVADSSCMQSITHHTVIPAQHLEHEGYEVGGVGHVHAPQHVLVSRGLEEQWVDG